MALPDRLCFERVPLLGSRQSETVLRLVLHRRARISECKAQTHAEMECLALLSLLWRGRYCEELGELEYGAMDIEMLLQGRCYRGLDGDERWRRGWFRDGGEA